MQENKEEEEYEETVRSEAVAEKEDGFKEYEEKVDIDILKHEIGPTILKNYEIL